MHSHSYAGRTSYNDGHWHNYQGMTSRDPDVPGHIHHMTGCTSCDDGHFHNYKSATGPAIYVGDKHYHMYCGVTEVADRHVHCYGPEKTSYYHRMCHKQCYP